jgi:allophanate hydrolase subunit 2
MGLSCMTGAPCFMTRMTQPSSPVAFQSHSNRLGIRLEGPAPKWARTNGGEGGSHPSNVHDHVYALGTINFTGNMPVRGAPCPSIVVC